LRPRQTSRRDPHPFVSFVFFCKKLNRYDLASRAFSLIEMIGVMTVASILALALAPVMLKQMDESAGQKEVAQLKNFAQTFRQGVLKTKTIPDQNGWGAFLATNLGMTTSQVLTNERGAARVYFIDPAGVSPPHLYLLDTLSRWGPLWLIPRNCASSNPTPFNT
jgi:prepilin-type N-terminal cleavage/methylation domain-containing protein